MVWAKALSTEQIPNAHRASRIVLIERNNDPKGWALPVTKPRKYRTPRPIADFGLAKIPRSFRYVER